LVASLSIAKSPPPSSIALARYCSVKVQFDGKGALLGTQSEILLTLLGVVLQVDYQTPAKLIAVREKQDVSWIDLDVPRLFFLVAGPDGNHYGVSYLTATL
jgi:hypothetical protein